VTEAVKQATTCERDPMKRMRRLREKRVGFKRHYSLQGMQGIPGVFLSLKPEAAAGGLILPVVLEQFFPSKAISQRPTLILTLLRRNNSDSGTERIFGGKKYQSA